MMKYKLSKKVKKFNKKLISQLCEREEMLCNEEKRILNQVLFLTGAEWAYSVAIGRVYDLLKRNNYASEIAELAQDMNDTYTAKQELMSHLNIRELDFEELFGFEADEL